MTKQWPTGSRALVALSRQVIQRSRDSLRVSAVTLEAALELRAILQSIEPSEARIDDPQA
jgi:hypothetical protein